MEMVTIPKKEYQRLKALDTEQEFLETVERSMKDYKEGNFTEI